MNMTKDCAERADKGSFKRDSTEVKGTDCEYCEWLQYSSLFRHPDTQFQKASL